MSVKISYENFPGMLLCFYFNGCYTFWSCFPCFCSWGSSDLNLFRDLEHGFPCSSIFPGFILFFYPCFPFALSLYLFLSHCIVCILVNYLKSFFGTQRSINKSINTSCVCKYGTLFLLKQFSHPLALWVPTHPRKEVGRMLDHPYFAGKEAKVHLWMKWLAEKDRSTPPTL